MRRPLLPLLLAPLLAGAFAACGITGPRDETRLTLLVGPETIDCVGLVPRKCLAVRERPDAPWTAFYDEIAGFAHEPGFAYTLRVARREIADPPADASRFAYRLLRVLRKEPAPPG